MFSLWGVDCGNMTGYQDAVKVWEKKPTWRDSEGEYDERSIRDPSRGQGRKQRYLTVRKTTEGIAFKYHRTDVVTYVKDDSVVIRPWNSMSTDTFMRGCAPVGMQSAFSNDRFNLLKCCEAGDTRNHWSSIGSIWDIDGASARFTRSEAGTWIPDEGSTTPFEVPKANRKKGQDALKKYPYRDLGLWLNAATAMGVKPKTDYTLNCRRAATVVEQLETREWAPFLTCSDWRTNENQSWRTQKARDDNWSWRQKILTGVRHAIYEVEGVMDTELRPFLSSWEEVKSIRQLQTTYAWL